MAMKSKNVSIIIERGFKMFLKYFLAAILPLVFGICLYLSLGGNKTISNIIRISVQILLTTNMLSFFILSYIEKKIAWSTYESSSLILKYYILTIFFTVVISGLIRLIEVKFKYKLVVQKISNLAKLSLIIVIILFSVIMAFFSKYYAEVYENLSLDEVLFYLNSGLQGANLSVIYNFFKDNGLLMVSSLIFISIPIFIIRETFSTQEQYVVRKTRQTFYISMNSYRVIFAYTISILIITMIFSYKTLGVSAYLEKLNDYSTFIGEKYVSLEDVKLKFPENKRNLIVIYLESMETTMMSKNNGGGWEYSVMPELEKLALESINFSNTDAVGGSYSTTGTTWTVAGLVATTAGLPLKTPIGNNEYVEESFLSGAITLGDILKSQGYNLKVMFGSDASFGGRKQYFSKHGDYDIFDLNTAIERKLMAPEEKVFWGIEDGTLFKWAKEELLQLAGEDKPFNFNLLTVNTHFTDGWLEEGTQNNYSTQYENVHAYSSKQVSEFINWLQQQDFYKDTTVVLLGDHNSMQSNEYYKDKVIGENFQRVTYNAFLNSLVKPVKEKKRSFSSLDMFPTLLASIGVEIPGNRLGLGTNLYSEESTLFEKYGISYVNHELNRNSIFYNTKILKDDYMELRDSK